MAQKCEWCGETREQLASVGVKARRGWMCDPFEGKEAVSWVCSDGCRAETESYYARFHDKIKMWASVFFLLFAASFGLSIPLGYAYFRWAAPASIALGGLWIFMYPFFNNYKRDKEGSLKMPLRKSIGYGRWTGIVFVIIAAALAYINTLLPVIPLFQ